MRLIKRLGMKSHTSYANQNRTIGSLANKLKRPNLSSIDYWKTLKSFNLSNSTAITTLLHDDTYYSDNVAKANFLNDFLLNKQ